MMKIEKGNTKVCLCQETLAVTVEKGQTRWEWTEWLSAGTALQRRKLSFSGCKKHHP